MRESPVRNLMKFETAKQALEKYVAAKVDAGAAEVRWNAGPIYAVRFFRQGGNGFTPAFTLSLVETFGNVSFEIEVGINDLIREIRSIYPMVEIPEASWALHASLSRAQCESEMGKLKADVIGEYQIYKHNVRNTLTFCFPFSEAVFKDLCRTVNRPRVDLVMGAVNFLIEDRRKTARN